MSAYDDNYDPDPAEREELRARTRSSPISCAST
jgi:hypothetical protein